MSTDAADGRTPDNDPFTPGYGAVPEVWAGRELQFADFATAWRRVRAGTYEQARLLSGDRGVGKTAFLKEIEDEARRGAPAAAGLGRVAPAWVVRVTAQPGEALLADLIEGLGEEARRHGSGAGLVDGVQSAARRLSGVTVAGTGASLHPPPAPDDAPGRRLQRLLIEVGEAARADSTGLLVELDELQNAGPRALAAVGIALQEAQGTAVTDTGPRGERVRHHLPICVFVASLPGLQDRIRTAGITFFERVRHHDFGLLAEADVGHALRTSAENRAVAFDADALDALVARIGGYPYFLHIYGSHVWRAGRGAVITADEVERGTAEARVAIARFYGERLRGLGDRQHDWLRAAAVLEPASRTTGAVAAELGGTSESLASTFQALHARGLLRRGPGRGRFEFALPGLEEHLRAVEVDR